MQKDKTKEWYCNQNWMNCAIGVLLLVLVGGLVLCAVVVGDQIARGTEPGLYAITISSLILLLVASIVGHYYLRKRITFLESNERTVEQFRKIVIEAITFANTDKLSSLLNIDYALSYCAEINQPFAFGELVRMFNKERIGVDFSHLWFDAAALGHVEIMNKIQEFELCDKDVQLAGKVTTAAHVALDQLPPKIDVIRYLVNIGADLTVRRVSDQKTPYELVPNLYREACKLLPETAPEERPEETEETSSEVLGQVESKEDKPEENGPEAERAEIEQVESAEPDGDGDKVVDLLDEEKESESKEAGFEENTGQDKSTG